METGAKHIKEYQPADPSPNFFEKVFLLVFIFVVIRVVAGALIPGDPPDDIARTGVTVLFTSVLFFVAISVLDSDSIDCPTCQGRGQVIPVCSHEEQNPDRDTA